MDSFSKMVGQLDSEAIVEQLMNYLRSVAGLRRWCVLVGILLFYFSMVVPAQTPDTATIHGRVVDQSQAAVPEVQITVQNTLTGFQRRSGVGCWSPGK
jgi:hypothetical protein